jgi:hypothetical protein
VSPSGVVTNAFGFIYDNVLYSSDPSFDVYGLLYTDISGVKYNVWNDGRYWESYYDQSGAVITTDLTEGSVARVPEPQPVTLVLFGLLSLAGLSLARKFQQAR